MTKSRTGDASAAQGSAGDTVMLPRQRLAAESQAPAPSPPPRAASSPPARPPTAQPKAGFGEIDEDEIDRFVDDAFLAIEEDIRDTDEDEPAIETVAAPPPAEELHLAQTPPPRQAPPVEHREPSPPLPVGPREQPLRPRPQPERPDRLERPQRLQPSPPPMTERPTSPPPPLPAAASITPAPVPPPVIDPSPGRRPLHSLDIPVAPAAVEFIEESGETETPGRRYGKYLLLDRIAVGGMAEVFKAKQLGLEGFEKLVAIKRILPHLSDNDDFVRMFIDEAKVAAQLTHQNICQIYDLGEQDTSYFLAMEFIYGKDLKSLVERGKELGKPMAPHHAALIISKLCAGLDYAHRKKDLDGNDLNIVHRDISPQNILVSYEGEVKLIDFGIAKAASKASVTRAGALKGKILYMSPEQAQGMPLDKRSDIFSLGTLLFEMLTGRRLFMAPNEHAILRKVREAKILPPSSFTREVPRELDRIVLKALQKSPEDRYQSASEMQRDLDLFVLQSSDRTPASFDLAAYMHELFADEIREETTREQAPAAARQRRELTPPPRQREGAIADGGKVIEEDTKGGEVLALDESGIGQSSEVMTDPGVAFPRRPPRRKKSLLNPVTIAVVLFLVIAVLLALRQRQEKPTEAPPGQPAATEQIEPAGAPDSTAPDADPAGDLPAADPARDGGGP